MSLSPTFLKKLPDSELIVLDSLNNQDGSSKSSVYIHGEKSKKKDIISYLDNLS